jgi:hypothetical protein
VDIGKQTSGRFQLAINERRVEDQPRCIVADLRLPPQFNLALQRLEIPLDPVDSNRDRINQVETLGVFGKHRRERTWDNVSKSTKLEALACRDMGLSQHFDKIPGLNLITETPTAAAAMPEANLKLKFEPIDETESSPEKKAAAPEPSA